MEHRNIQIFNKMITRAQEAMIDTENMSYDEFLNDNKTIRASVFSISQVGELARTLEKLDKEAFVKYSDINWIEIKGLRNRIVHDYGGIQFKVIWEVIQEDLPQLVNKLEKIIETTKEK